jgi:myo-inositol-1(or 4)-monophosphatase
LASLERRVAIDAARAAGRLLRDELSGARHIAYKGSPTNLVTEMDQRAEALILERIRRAFPDDAILAEEQGAATGRSGRRWIVDPLDGTTNYAHGLPLFGVSIALESARRLVLGVVYDPARDELFVAERGGGATLNGEPIRVSECGRLDQSLLVTGFPYDIRTTADTNLPEYAALSLRTLAVRRFGSAALDLSYVAAGRLEAFWELTLGPWDMAAGGLIVLEAGGQVTDVRGGPWRLEGPGVLASNGRIHAQVLTALTEARGDRR